MSWRTLLVLGGTGSGKEEYAAAWLADAAQVRRAGRGADADPATGAGGAADPDTGATGPVAGAGLAAVAGLVAEAKPDEVILVEDLTDWLPTPGRTAVAPPPGLDALVAAVRTTPARVVLVSAEIGLAPTTAAGRRLAEALGAVNRALAAVVDAAVLVVAGQPSWLKGGPAPAAPVTATEATAPGGPALDPTHLADLPRPDEAARAGAADRLARLGPVALGALAEVVTFAAGCQGTPTPEPWQRVQVLVLHGDHRGGAAAGAIGSADRAGQLRDGTDPLARLASPIGASVRIVETAAAAPIESGPAMPESEVETALGHGWRLAEQAVDEGADVIVLGSIGDGAAAAAAAVTTMLAPATEPAGLLGRVRSPQGTFDDQAWMRRCAAVRDAVARVRRAARSGGRRMLAELGGPDLATATGVLLGAAARRTPVLLDGPVGATAGLVARNLAPHARHWWLLPDPGGHPLVTRAGDLLGLTPLLDLRLEVGEGGTALAALPLLRSALTLAATLEAKPRPGQGTAGED